MGKVKSMQKQGKVGKQMVRNGKQLVSRGGSGTFVSDCGETYLIRTAIVDCLMSIGVQEAKIKKETREWRAKRETDTMLFLK